MQNEKHCCNCGCEEELNEYENCHCHECEGEEEIRLPLIGDRAPYFTANTTNGVISFPDDYHGKWVVLFSHPADFTPVCTTEFMTFANRQKEFKSLNTELVGLSIDSVFSHIAWLNQIKNYTYKDMKNIEVTFPVIDDVSRNVALKYGMLHPYVSTTATVRSVFIIDPDGIIRTILYYPQSTGRNFDEIIRIIKSLQIVDKEQCATPADWQEGEDVIVPPANTLELAKQRLKKPDGMTVQDWFLCFKKPKGKK